MKILTGFCKRLRTISKFWALSILILLSISAHAQKIATLEVNLHGETMGLDIPVHVNLDPITHSPDSTLSLIEIVGKKRSPVIFQIENGQQRKMIWLVHDNNKKQVFELVKSNSYQVPLNFLKANRKEGSLTLEAGKKNLLRYHYKTVYPPQGIDSAYKRSAFIHPLWSPHGQILTRIQPPDHYHHYGLWNPWTHVLYEGDTVDFWNIGGKQGTVRFADFISVSAGDVFGEYAALHEHVVFPKGGKEKIALNEIQTVRVYVPLNSPDYYIADISMQLNCPTSPVRLLEYRYGGLGWRATEQWTNKNSSVLSSEGKNRKNADGSKARWCIVQGTVDGENAGVVMMSYPTNYNHPEPLRIWPENIYDRGDMFVNFATTKDTDWSLEPGKNYVLKYRLIVFNGSYSKEKAENAWLNFATPPDVTVIKNKNAR